MDGMEPNDLEEFSGISLEITHALLVDEFGGT